MSKRKELRKNDGFTLIEVLLSIAILALISIPLMKYFSDSLRYSVETAEKQRATLAAQETIEFIKSQKRLVYWQAALDTETNLTKMHFDATEELKNHFNVSLSLPFDKAEENQPLFNHETGAGTLKYQYEETSSVDGKKLDIIVTLSSDVPVAAVSKPVLYGIDSMSNIIASEYNEQDEAILYFKALNEAAIEQGKGNFIIVASPSPTPTVDPNLYYDDADGDDVATITSPEEKYKDLLPIDEEGILKNLERIIHIDMEEVKESVFDSSYIHVCVYYEYSCTDVTGPEAVKYITNPMIDTNVQYLEGVYLMFSKMNSANDQIVIHWNHDEDGSVHPLVPSQAEYPKFWLVCQNLGNVAPEDDLVPGYEKLFIKMTGNSAWTEYNAEIYTNIEDKEHNVDFQMEASGGYEIKDLTSASVPVRVVKVDVEVYKSGEAGVYETDGETPKYKPLVSMSTTKAE